MQEEHEAVGPIPDSLLRQAVAASILYLNGRVMLRRNILVYDCPRHEIAARSQSDRLFDVCRNSSGAV